MDADKLKDASPWHPMTDQVVLKHLGKLAEELGECSSAVARCIIQGIDEKEPVTGKINREWLEDEIADVYADMMLVQQHFKLNGERMAGRTLKKMIHLRQWHGLA